MIATPKRLSPGAFARVVRSVKMEASTRLIAYDIVVNGLPIKQAAVKYGISYQRCSQIKIMSEEAMRLSTTELVETRLRKVLQDKIIPSDTRERLLAAFQKLGFFRN